MAIKPSPIPNESGIGYALRYAQRNGIQYLSSLYKAQEIEWLCKGINSKKIDTGRLLEIEATESLSATFNPLFKVNRLLTARVCLDCITNNQLIAKEVQNPFVTTCSVHKAHFVEWCRCCNKHLEWDISLLDARCTNINCGALLAPHLNAGYPGDLTEQQVSDCLLANYYYSIAPGNLHCVGSKWPKLELPTQAVTNGFRLLTSKEAANDWLLKLAKEFPGAWPSTFRSIINTTLANLIGDWKNKALFEKQLFRPSPPCLSNTLKVSVEQATKLLVTNRDGLQRLQEAELVSRTHSRLHLDSIIDISLVLVLLETQKTKQRCQKSLMELREIMDFYALNLVDILIAIKSGVLTTNYKPGSHITDSIFVTEQELKTFGLRKFQEFRPQYVSFNKASKLTKVSVSSLRLLRKLGRLRPPSVAIHGGHDLCNFEDVIALRNSVESDQLDLFASRVPKPKRSHLVDKVGG
ncbi:hypothetical protein [Shewanella spartinae]|uniref:hypothetical protein n=1 Tax=Shewanella spartinae TaxID=2864205 RepID=UPI001C656A1D|nr:hypothetical protein [Shewanella spartinae]QYJ95702.1 hypothetical protein K0I31_10245 [Shewanella spartinae]